MSTPTVMSEHFGTGTKKVRGRSPRSLKLIKAMIKITERLQPITGRGVGYQLFIQNLIASMERNDMRSVYRLLKAAREEGLIDWEYIVDETRDVEIVSSWDNPAQFIRCVQRSYRRDFWKMQPVRLEVWSEKNTAAGLLKPTLDELGVGFRVVHGFGSATVLHDISQYDAGPLIIIYVGDYDPSGMWMSERDIPERIERYGNGNSKHITVERVALRREDCDRLGRRLGFHISRKKDDPRTPWFRKTYGDWCWELDALDPNDLRDRVEQAIRKYIDLEAWERCRVIDEAERESLKYILDQWHHRDVRK